jgi:Family of unknown function (DUF6325)
VSDTETAEFESMGPIDYLVVEFPANREPDGSSLGALADLESSGVIHILDLVCVAKSLDGSLKRVAIEQLPFTGDIDLSLFAEAASGIVGDEDLMEAGSVLNPGTTGALLIYENRWAAPFGQVLRKSGAQIVANGRIPLPTLLAAIEADV